MVELLSEGRRGWPLVLGYAAYEGRASLGDLDGSHSCYYSKRLGLYISILSVTFSVDLS